MAVILSKTTSIFLIMAAGFVINRAKIIPGSATKFFVDLLVMITTPCMILSSVTSREFSSDTARVTAEVFACGVGLFAITFITGYFLCKKILRVKPSEDLGVYIMIFSTVNNGFMGFPITNAIFGNDILYLMILNNICLTLYMYSAGPFIFNISSGKGSFNARRLLKTFCNPSTIVSIVSVIMLFIGIRLPSLLFDSVTLIGDVTVPLSMLVVGMQLGESNMGRIIKNKSLTIMSVLKMFLLPMLIFVIVNWLPLSTEVKVTIIFAAAFPAAVIVSALALMEDKNSLLAAEGIALTTLISVASIPLCALFLTGFYGI